MRQLHNSTLPVAAISMSDTFGRIQAVPLSDGVVLIDVQGRHYSTDGRLYTDHGFARLTIAQAIRLHELLGHAITAADAAEPRQASLRGMAYLIRPDQALRRSRRPGGNPADGGSPCGRTSLGHAVSPGARRTRQSTPGCVSSVADRT
jgi:hypothetical protein